MLIQGPIISFAMEESTFNIDFAEYDYDFPDGWYDSEDGYIPDGWYGSEDGYIPEDWYVPEDEYIPGGWYYDPGDEYIPDEWYDPGFEDSESIVDIAATSAHQISGMVQTGVTRRNTAFRRGPGASYSQIRVVNGSTNIRITGRTGVWYRVVVGNTVGFMRQSAVARTRQNAVVTTNNAHVRAGRGTSHRSLIRVPRGQRVRIARRSANWSRVTVSGHTGWIRNRDLNINAMRPGRTIANNVTIHTRPRAAATIRHTLPQGSRVMIVQRTTNGWSQIRIHNRRRTLHGWVRTNQIETRMHTRRLVRNGALRSGPSSSYNRLRTIPRNTSVTVRTRTGNWYHVHVVISGRRHYGWLHRNNLPTLVTTLTTSGALSYTALVNRDFRMASNFSPHDLRNLNVRSHGGTHRMRGTAANQAESLFQAASNAGHTLLAVSGYRSFATQQATHQHWINVLGLEQALRVSAPPGHSEHQLGLALDLSTQGLGGALSSAFSSTAEGTWVRNNAHRFGFIIRYPQSRETDTGFMYEPWHIRFVGVNAATQIFNQGLILEEFLGR